MPCPKIRTWHFYTNRKTMLPAFREHVKRRYHMASVNDWRSDPIRKLRVEFYDPSYDIEKDDAFHGYRAEIPLHVTAGQFDDQCVQTKTFDVIERTYGTIDIGGTGTTFEMQSVEISKEQAHVVFDLLCDMLREFITGPKTETYIN